jgi:hypothetical protein
MIQKLHVARATIGLISIAGGFAFLCGCGTLTPSFRERDSAVLKHSYERWSPPPAWLQDILEQEKAERQVYLEQHPELPAPVREAIAENRVTLGMAKRETLFLIKNRYHRVYPRPNSHFTRIGHDEWAGVALSPREGIGWAVLGLICSETGQWDLILLFRNETLVSIQQSSRR